MFKKALSLFLSFVIVFSVFSITAVTANAEETSTINTETMAEDVNISGTNSLGNMLTDVYSKNVSEEDFIGNNIYEIEVENSTVYVDLQVLTNAKLVVALYDESTQEMLSTGMKDICTEDTVVQVELDVDNMPQYFVIKAYMLDLETNVPLCKQFECDTYTWRMQKFLAKTTEDFEQDKVLALDESNDNNFLVYNDETVQIEGDENTNVVTVTDETTQKYVIENIDESISSLQAGDIFSHTYGDEENVLIVKVSSITIDGTTATIYGEEVELEEAFDFIKIDASQGTSETTVDNSELEDGVKCIGIEDESTSKCPSSVGVPLLDGEVTKEEGWKYELDKKNGPIKIAGSLNLKFALNLKFYYDADLFKTNEVEVSFLIKSEVKIGANVELSTNEKNKLQLKLGTFGFSPVPGVYVDFTPSFIVEGKANFEINGILSNQVGTKYKNGEKTDLCTSPKYHSEIKVSGEIFIGISFKPKVAVLGWAISIEMEAKAGVNITAKLEYSTDNDPDAEEQHTCISCINGEIIGHIELTFEIEFLNCENLKFSSSLFTMDLKISNFYYSFDTGKFAFTSCPNHTYRQTITIANREKNNPVLKDIYINGVKADENHTANLYLTKGTHEITVINFGIIMLKKTIDVSEASEQTLYLEPRYLPNRYDSVVGDITPTITTTGQCGDDVYYTLYSDGTLDITGTGDMYDYQLVWDNPFQDLYIETVKINNNITSIGDYAFTFCYNLKNITMTNSIKSIGNGAFDNCKNLESISIPDSVVTIGSSAFSECSRLKNITLPDSITSIDNNTFNHCESLTNITLPKNLKYIGEFAFNYCSSLETVIIPNSVSNIGRNAFQACTNLSNITLSNCLSSIENSVFSSCSNLTNVTIPKSVISIGSHAFSYCSSLVNIDIPNGVTSIGDNAFYSCSNLVNLNISDSVKSIGNDIVFHCYGLESINVDKNNTTYYSYDGVLFDKKSESLIFYPTNKKGLTFTIPDNITSIGNYAFYMCSQLRNITMPDSIKIIGNGAFSNCSNLTNVTIPNSVTKVGSYLFDNCSRLTNIVLSANLSILPKGMFLDCVNLKNITIENGVTNIEEYVFYNCLSLESITVDKNNKFYSSIDGVLFDKNEETLIFYPVAKINTEYAIPNSVTSINSYAFHKCSALTNVIIPAGVTNISDHVFYECKRLTNVLMSDNVTTIGDYAFAHTRVSNISLSNSLKTIGLGAFSHCSNLKSITIPDNVTTIDGDAFSCSGLTSITIPSKVTNIGYGTFSYCYSLTDVIFLDGVKNISRNMFRVCYKLTNITIPNSVTSIGDYAFSECSNLTNITIPNSVTSIGNYVFSSCRGLKSFTIPNNITNISWRLFDGCTNLTSVTIPTSVTNIEYGAFEECPNLTHVYYNGSVEDWNKITIGYGNDGLSRAIIHYGLSTKTNSPVINHLTHKIQMSQEEPTTTPTKQYSRTNLVPNTEAVLMIVRGRTDDYEINASTLRYIAQTTVDENGTATFNTYGDFADNSWSVVLIFGECTHSSFQWKTVKEATHTETGLDVCICDICGEVIDSNEIDVLAPEYPLGDVNSDMIVNIDDATQIQKYLVELISLDETQIKDADIDNDGMVSVRDATEIQKYLIGISSYLNNL